MHGLGRHVGHKFRSAATSHPVRSAEFLSSPTAEFWTPFSTGIQEFVPREVLSEEPRILISIYRGLESGRFNLQIAVLA